MRDSFLTSPVFTDRGFSCMPDNKTDYAPFIFLTGQERIPKKFLNDSTKRGTTLRKNRIFAPTYRYRGKIWPLATTQKNAKIALVFGFPHNS